MDVVVHDRAAILAVGDELTLGQSLDSNSQWIASRLVEGGVSIVEHVTIADDLERLTATILRLSTICPLLVVTGGLGPTKDDLTRQALARAMDDPLVEDPDAVAWLDAKLRDLGHELNDARRHQAMRPRGAECLKNDVGTAPGLWGRIVSPVEIMELGDFEGRTISSEDDICDVVCLPGPPREMKPMFEREVLTRLHPPEGARIAVRLVRTFGLPEVEVAARLGALMDRDRNPKVGTTASGGVVTVRVRAEGRGGAAARAASDAVEEVRSRLGEFVFGEGELTLADALVAALRERDERLVVVESCTGGMLGATITSVAGSSAVFDGGWITYANSMKVGEVGVAEKLIRGGPGAVSREVALAMAEGGLAAAAREGVDATHALAVTGIAGPEGGSAEKPVGTVWIARASRPGAGADVDSEARLFRIPGDRSDVRERSSMLALGVLWSHLRRASVEPGSAPPHLIWERA